MGKQSITCYRTGREFVRFLDLFYCCYFCLACFVITIIDLRVSNNCLMLAEPEKRRGKGKKRLLAPL